MILTFLESISNLPVTTDIATNITQELQNQRHQLKASKQELRTWQEAQSKTLTKLAQVEEMDGKWVFILVDVDPMGMDYSEEKDSDYLELSIDLLS